MPEGIHKNVNPDGTMTISDALDARLAAEAQEIEALEAQLRANQNTDFNSNTLTTETHVEPSEPQKAGADKPKIIDGSGKDITPEEEAEEQEAEAEVKAEAEKQPEPTVDKPKPKVRPWSELRKERRANTALMSELEQERAARRQLEERFRVIESKVAPIEQRDENKVPEFNQDPLANLDGRSKLTETQLTQLRQQLAVQQLQSEINAEETAFSRDHSDYTNARDYLINRELDRARLLFRALPEEQREQYAQAMVNQRRSILIATARESKQSIAALAYDLAKSEGWKPKDSEEAPTNAPAQAKARVEAQKAREQIAQSSLGGVGQTGTIKKALKMEDIMTMSEAEMDKLAAQNEAWDDEIQK